MTLLKETKAVVITSIGKAEIKTVPVPALREDYILVRTTAVALNPTDWKHIDGINLGPNQSSVIGTRVGCDYAGIVEQVGPKVTKPFKKGDLICGPAHGSNAIQPEDGTFAEYIVVKGDVQIKVPSNLKDYEAATLGIGITTVGQGLYQGLSLPLPSPTAPIPDPDPNKKILIYGGSTATGILGIQFASLSGYSIATTCSPHNFPQVQSLVSHNGSLRVFDYRFPTLLPELKEWAGDDLTLAWDCVASTDSAKLCASVLAKEGGKYRSLLRVPEEVVKGVNEGVDSGFTFAYTALGERFKKAVDIPAVEGDFEFAKMFWELAEEFLELGRIKTVEVEVNRGGKGGLEGVLVGLRELKDGRVSGRKLVYTFDR
ncbi:putative zinc-binding oxidoreductase ToxD [Triangularia setosa]|uniref:Zinc-binding oxidoreductase ToxD n=1 Tax=Triangularia setosa TaxID=2587417 RepID=A0AAN6W7T3_9PEZI|nr:putative zinc-binding oxidoreductase ToxD [Podospora setosa]